MTGPALIAQHAETGRRGVAGVLARPGTALGRPVAGQVAAQVAVPEIHRQAVPDPFAVIDTGPLTAATAKGLLDLYATLTDGAARDAVIRAHTRSACHRAAWPAGWPPSTGATSGSGPT